MKVLKLILIPLAVLALTSSVAWGEHPSCDGIRNAFMDKCEKLIERECDLSEISCEVCSALQEEECEGLAELEAEYNACKAAANTLYTIALSTARQTEASRQYAEAMKLCNEILVQINNLKEKCGILVKPPAPPLEPSEVVVEPMEPAIPATPSEEVEVKTRRWWHKL